MTNLTKFFYIRDSKSTRVMTIARAFDDSGKKLHIGWALSRPTIKVRSNGKAFVYTQGDQFTKARGRDIATGRLEKTPLVHKLKKDESPLLASLQAILDSKDTPSSARRLAKIGLGKLTYKRANVVEGNESDE